MKKKTKKNVPLKSITFVIDKNTPAECIKKVLQKHLVSASIDHESNELWLTYLEDMSKWKFSKIKK